MTSAHPVYLDHHATTPVDPGPEPYIVAAGTAVRSFPGAAHLEIADVYGQLDWLTEGQGVREYRMAMSLT